MALVILGKTPCAISGKTITGADKVLCFPPYPVAPDDPAAICSDACVLRAEFEIWEFKDNVIQLVKKFWHQQYHASRAFTVIYEDDEYLFVMGKVEAKIRVLFLEYAFVIDVPWSMWQNLCGQLLDMEDTVAISPYSTTTLSFSEKMGKVEICIEIRGNGWDCIELSLTKWSRFKSVLTASQQSLDRVRAPTPSLGS